jgi:hypothetical protein
LEALAREVGEVECHPIRITQPARALGASAEHGLNPL